MSESTYMFIDGAFLQRQISSARKSYDLDENVDIDYSKLIRRASRAFYYDSYPSEKPEQTEEAHIEEFRKTEILFDKIGTIPNLHVRHGMSRYQKRKRGAEQKAVDILLALDVYQHAIRGNMEVAIIVASDLDFAPVLEALLNTRVRSRLWFDPKKASPLLIDAADIAEPFNEETVMRFMPDDISQRYVVSHEQKNPEPYFDYLKKVSDLSRGDWHFTVYLDDMNKRYIGHIVGRDGVDITCRDFRSVRFHAEGLYRINLEALKVPKEVHLK